MDPSYEVRELWEDYSPLIGEILREGDFGYKECTDVLHGVRSVHVVRVSHVTKGTNYRARRYLRLLSRR